MHKQFSKRVFRSKCKNKRNNNKSRSKSQWLSLYHHMIYRLGTKHNRVHIKLIKKYHHSLNLNSNISNPRLLHHRFNPNKMFNRTLPLSNLKWMYLSKYMSKLKLPFSSYSHQTPISKSNNQMPNPHPKPINHWHLKTSNNLCKWINKLNNSPSLHHLNRTLHNQCNNNSKTNRPISYHHSNSLGNLIHRFKIH